MVKSFIAQSAPSDFVQCDRCPHLCCLISEAGLLHPWSLLMSCLSAQPYAADGIIFWYWPLPKFLSAVTCHEGVCPLNARTFLPFPSIGFSQLASKVFTYLSLGTFFLLCILKCTVTVTETRPWSCSSMYSCRVLDLGWNILRIIRNLVVLYQWSLSHLMTKLLYHQGILWLLVCTLSVCHTNLVLFFFLISCSIPRYLFYPWYLHCSQCNSLTLSTTLPYLSLLLFGSAIQISPVM